MSRRLQRAMQALEWSRRPVRWAVAFSIKGGPFPRLRRIPLALLSRLVAAQVRVQGL